MQYSPRMDSDRNRDLLEVVLNNKDDQRVSTDHDLDPTLQKLGQSLQVKDNSRPSSFVSKRSTDLSNSQDGLNNEQHKSGIATHGNKSPNYPVQTTIGALGIVCILSAIMCAVTVQIVFQLSGIEGENSYRNNTLLNSVRGYFDVIEVTTAFASFVLVLNVSSLLVCSMQCFFAARLLQVTEGHERYTCKTQLILL